MNESDKNSSPKIPSISDPTSVYYLNPSDNSGSSLCPVILNGETYHIWEKVSKRALQSKNKTCLVDGTLDITEVSEDDKVAWKKCNATVVNWIFFSVDKNIQKSIVAFDNARELWIELEQRYTQGHGPKIYQLKKELNDLEQEATSVTEYYSKLKGIWDELDEYTKLETCTCGSTCKTLINLLKEKENEKVFKFLMGLSKDKYKNVRSTIIAMDPWPSLARCYSMVLREEQQLKAEQRDKPNVQASAFVTRNQPEQRFQMTSGRNIGDEVKTCSHCKRQGHDKFRCFEIIGFPEHWRNRGGRTGRGRDRVNVDRGLRGATTSAV